jgi:hypothetical protein
LGSAPLLVAMGNQNPNAPSKRSLMNCRLKKKVKWLIILNIILKNTNLFILFYTIHKQKKICLYLYLRERGWM